MSLAHNYRARILTTNQILHINFICIVFKEIFTNVFGRCNTRIINKSECLGSRHLDDCSNTQWLQAIRKGAEMWDLLAVSIKQTFQDNTPIETVSSSSDGTNVEERRGRHKVVSNSKNRPFSKCDSGSLRTLFSLQNSLLKVWFRISVNSALSAKLSPVDWGSLWNEGNVWIYNPALVQIQNGGYN